MRNRVRDNKQSDYKVYNGEVKGYDKILLGLLYFKNKGLVSLYIVNQIQLIIVLLDYNNT